MVLHLDELTGGYVPSAYDSLLIETVDRQFEPGS